MPAHVPEYRWTYVIFAVFLIIDSLMAVRVFQRLIVKNMPISPDGPVFFVLLLGLQILLIWLFARLRQVISHNQQLQHTYKQELDLAQQLMESTDIGLTVMDENGRFVYVNHAFEQLVGRTSSEILNRTPLDFVDRQSVSSDPRLVPATLEQWSGQHLDLRLRLLRPDGQTVDVLLTGKPRHHDGRVVGKIASFIPLPRSGSAG